MPKRKREAAEEAEREAEETFSATDPDTEDGERGKDGGEAPARKLSKKALYAQRFRTEKRIAKGKRQLARALKRARRFEHLRLAKRIKRCEAGEDAGTGDEGDDGAAGSGGGGGGGKDQTKLARLQREMDALKVRKYTKNNKKQCCSLFFSGVCCWSALFVFFMSTLGSFNGNEGPQWLTCTVL
jgi:hypothetical protein